MTRTIREGNPLNPHTEDLDELTVEANGRAVAGWKSIEIQRRLDAASGSFRLEIQHVEPWPITAGGEVRIFIGGDLVVTGYVDTVEASISRDSTSLIVSGRDRTEDLVDCAVPESPTELARVTLEQVAAHVAAPYGVKIESRMAEDLPFDVYRFNAGESAWAAIERGCRKRGVLAFADQEGRLVLAFPATARSDRDIAYGDFLSGTLRWQHADRFRLYVVTGQRPGNDDAWGAAVAEIRGQARDGSVSRPRTLVKVAESPVDQAAADQYAAWLATVRAARAAQVSLEMLGWRQEPRGRLWQVNQLVGVSIPRWRLDGELLLVNSVTFKYPPRTTTLELVRRNAYSAEPSIEPETDPLRGWGDDRRTPVEELDE